MNKELPTQAELDRVRVILQEKHGVTFFPKRKLDIPIVNPEKVFEIVGAKNKDDAIAFLTDITTYLSCAPIGDKFGTDHRRRREWRGKMRTKFGIAFSLVYEESNQFRANIMVPGLTAIHALVLDATENKKTTLVDNLMTIDDELSFKLTGEDPKTGEKMHKRYDEMESYDEKLDVVHFIEDKFLEVVKLFA